MKYIVVFANGSLDITKPMIFRELRFSKVIIIKQQMNHTYTKEDLLNMSDPSKNKCFIQAMDIDTINAETSNMHYTAYQFLEQEGPKTLLLDIVKKLSVKQCMVDTK